MEYLKIPKMNADYPIERFALDKGIGFTQASEADLPLIYRLRKETITPIYHRAGEEWLPSVQQKWIDENVDPSQTHLIHRKSPIGCVGLYPVNPTTVWLRHFYIQPGYQGHGFGSEVLESITEMADVMALDIELFKVPRNGPRPFYERHGFVAIDERDRELWMRRMHNEHRT